MNSALKVDQFVPVLLPNDAVGNHTLQTRVALAEGGVESEIWTGLIHRRYVGQAQRYEDYDRRPQRGRSHLLLYQAASVSGGMVDYLLSRPEPKSMSYHNLTPPAFYEPFAPEIANGLRAAESEIERLLPDIRVATAASEFNAADLRRRGVPDVRVVPPFLGAWPQGKVSAQQVAELRANNPGLTVLFVGRLVPNKTHQHLIRVIAALRTGIDPYAKLNLVGPEGPPEYVRTLHRMADRIAPGGVSFKGVVGDSELLAHYAAADVFLCMSEHEGFGLPLIEAMRAGLPVVAYDRGAVAETLGGAGVLLRTNEPIMVAEVVARVAGDVDLREKLVQRQYQRATEIETFPRSRIITEAALAAAA